MNSGTLAWVTGARGFIGRHLVRLLIAKGYRVAGIGHGAWPDVNRAGLEIWVDGDVTVANLTDMQKKAGTPDIVFHLAGGSSVGGSLAAPREDFQRTVVSTANLLEWLRLSGVGARLVAVSSAAVYGRVDADRIPESHSPRPLSPYGSHKLMMEELCRSYAENYGQHVIIPRVFSVVGVGLKKQLPWDLCDKMSEGVDEVYLGGTGDEMRDWIDVRDVVDALESLSAYADACAPVVNLGSGKPTCVSVFASLFASEWARVFGCAPRICFTGERRPGDPVRLVPDIALLKGKYGVQSAIPLERSVFEYVRWYKEERGL